jgi:oligopeptide transport system ATP-binding protein
MSSTNVLLKVQNLKVEFPVKSSLQWPWSKDTTLIAVNEISFEVHQGKTLGIVGESGCGKSSLAKAMVGLVPISSGSVLWKGQDLHRLNLKELRAKRKEMQMIFQDPLASLNPRMTIGAIIAEPLRTLYPKTTSKKAKILVQETMLKVGLLPNMINRYPHEFSGGQCQRIGVARALIIKPEFIICDEPVSALDVSIQAQVINLLKSLQEELSLSLMFIAHDLSVVKHISHEVAVMYLGRIMEIGSIQDVYGNPLHPYTKALLSSVPIPDPDLEQNKKTQVLAGELPSPIHPPSGCVFRTRCPIASIECSKVIPPLENKNGHKVACIKVP